MVPPIQISPAQLLHAYRCGIFPMAEHAEAEELHWFDPPQRTVFPLHSFHVPQRLRRTIRQRPYHITINQDFAGVIAACAAPSAHAARQETWINHDIVKLYTALHQLGQAHSLEAWLGDKLVGGLYGVHIGGAFFGESMFSRADDASKICLVYLVAVLRRQGFLLLDCQYKNPHLVQFGAKTISRASYQRQLAAACARHCIFGLTGTVEGGVTNEGATPGALDDVALAFLQAITQTS